MITSRRKSLERPTSGVTILEILIVLAVIGLIAGIVGPRVIGYLGRAKTETADLQINQIDNALQLFFIDLGRYPARSEGLSALLSAPAASTGWAGPYLTSDEALTDPWGRPYVYEHPEGADDPVVYTLGRDGERGGSGEDLDVGL